MTTENALPQGDNAAAGANNDDHTGAEHDHHQDDAGNTTGAEGGEEGGAAGDPPKKEKTFEQREIERLRRRVDNLTRKKHELMAAVQPSQQQQQRTDESDDEPVSMTRADLDRHIAERAKQLAPALTQQQALADRRQGIVTSLEKEWGAEKFNTLASDLDDVFDGLADRSGAPKAATDAIFESDNPKGLIEYLTDPDNVEEAERIATMSPTQAGRAIARIEDKIAAAGKAGKPKPSSAAAPLETPRGGGAGIAATKDTSKMTDAQYTEYRAAQRKSKS